MVKLPLRSNGALNTLLLKQQESVLRTMVKEELKELPLPQIAWHIYNNVLDVPLCACGKHRKFKGFGKGYSAACAATCYGKQQSAEQRMVERYGVKNSFQLEKTKDKITETVQSKYGVSHITQSKAFKQAFISTNLKRRGVEWPTQDKSVIEKRQNANLEKYGVVEPVALDWVKDKSKAANLQKYGAATWSASEEGKAQIKQSLKSFHDKKNPSRMILNDHEYVLKRYEELKNLTTLSAELNLQLNYVAKWFRFNGYALEKKSKATSIEIEIFNWLTKEGFFPSLHDRSLIKPYEIDLVVNHVGIEINGIYWHSYGSLETKEEKSRHLRKLEMAEDAGVSLIQFTDIEWNQKKDIIKSIILHRLGKSKPIYARKTKVKELTNFEVSTFLNENHFQGHIPASVNLGLFFENELVAVMNFSKARFNKHVKWELIRYAGKKFHNVVGGAEKLLKEFRLKHPGSILSYSDRMKFSGKLYEKLKFVKERVNGPSYHYTDKKNIFSRVAFQKHKLKHKFDNFDENLTEAENCFNNGLRRYWDCGTIAWILHDDI